MKNKIVLALCAVAVTSVILVGCGSSDKESADQPAITEETSEGDAADEITPVPTEEPVAVEEDQDMIGADEQESDEAVEDELEGGEILEEGASDEQAEETDAQEDISEETVSDAEAAE